MLPQAIESQAADLQYLPHYHLEVWVDPEAHLLRGRVEVRLDADDPRPRTAWWFHLPPNRFAALDERGPRRLTGSIPFGFNYLDPVQSDPEFPDGFTPGHIRILSVQDDTGQPLPYSRHENPDIPVGFSPDAGLMRVTLSPGRPTAAVSVTFETQLPHRYWEGWSESGIFAERWYPLLSNYQNGSWHLSTALPNPGHYSARVTVSQGGLLILPTAGATAVWPGIPLTLDKSERPIRTFPLLFLLRSQTATQYHGPLRIASVYGPGNKRMGQLVLDIATQFLDFVSAHYDLPAPGTELTIVQSDALAGDLRVANGLVVIPTVDYRESTLLDRVFVARLARAIAQQWFGETLWIDEANEAWLGFGPAGLLALRFFEQLYGPDAPTHAITDWLAPRYREHYFEQPVRQLRRLGQDAPLLTSLWQAPRQQVARVVVHHKAPLVLRQLEFAMGPHRFARGLRHLLGRYAHRQITTPVFQSVLTDAAGAPLDWFFAPWVYGNGGLDYALSDLQVTPTPKGYRSRVSFVRLEGARMPVEITVNTEAGEALTRRWAGESNRATLVFHTRSAPTVVVLDQSEELLESDRRNNYSAANLRVRPLFDWAKSRDVFVVLRGRLGGNAIDGNFAGLGVGVNTDPDNQFTAIPIYGQKSKVLNYELSWTHLRFLVPRLSLSLIHTSLGGQDFLGLAFDYLHDTPERIALTSQLGLNIERVDGFSQAETTASTLQTPGEVNNLSLLETFFVRPNGPTYHGLNLEVEHSQPSFGSDFRYTSLSVSTFNGLQIFRSHRVELELIRAGLSGEGPVQKQFLLGDPLVLRGYPRTLRLVYDQLLAARLDYRYTFSHGVHGREIQTRNITAIFFTDVGKGWNNGESLSEQRQRQDYGIGIEVELDILNQVAFPLRLELARPYHDPEYNSTQYIFFQALAFF